MNLINVKKCDDFSGIALTVVFWQSPISKHQLRMGNSPLIAEVRVENYSPLGVISHPKRQILGHCVFEDIQNSPENYQQKSTQAVRLNQHTFAGCSGVYRQGSGEVNTVQVL